MTPKSPSDLIRQYIERVARCRDPKPCRYGHFGCALNEGGPCSNEAASLLPQEEEDR